MLRNAFKLPFKLAGIPLYLDFSFLIILPLTAWMIARNLAEVARYGHLGLHIPSLMSGGMPWVIGLIAAVGLFVCVVLHELGHSLTARLYGVEVRRITLWLLGGVAEFQNMPRQRGGEAVVAIAGPIVSFALAALFWLGTAFIPLTYPVLWLLCLLLMTVNLSLGTFNLIPAMPMDGGRILRSLLALKLPPVRATKIAGYVAKVCAVGFAVWAFREMNFILGIMAVFIFRSSTVETQASAFDALAGLRVRDLMQPNIQPVPAAGTVGQLAQYFAHMPFSASVVADPSGRLVGAVTIDQVRAASPDQAIWQVMSTDLLAVADHARAADAYLRMIQSHSKCLFVVDHTTQVIGLITFADLERAASQRPDSANKPGSGLNVPRAVVYPG